MCSVTHEEEDNIMNCLRQYRSLAGTVVRLSPLTLAVFLASLSLSLPDGPNYEHLEYWFIKLISKLRRKPCIIFFNQQWRRSYHIE